ncbi:MAG: translation elongation factor Ts [Rhodospirillaceae bacterium]|nr:translation elongation factor Ts [Rhodospirillaceae bacterium]|tara:strand:+ start:80 stop:733 length:654 start_codon:yes stop_codon:yes gene_type:complete
MAVSAKQVQELRAKTGAGIMDCKKALNEAGGNLDGALEALRKSGLAASAKKAGRIASEGLVGSYIHGGGKIGVLVEINCETDFVGRNEDFQGFVRDVAMHVAAANPQYLNREEVPADIVAKEKEILAAQIADEGKPANVVEKIVEGRINKFFKEICLMDQPFIKEPKQSVAEIQNELVGKIGEKISIRRYVRFELGAGLEKRSEDFAAEVAKTAAGN